MKKFLPIALILTSISALAAEPSFDIGLKVDSSGSELSTILGLTSDLLNGTVEFSSDEYTISIGKNFSINSLFSLEPKLGLYLPRLHKERENDVYYGLKTNYELTKDQSLFLEIGHNYESFIGLGYMYHIK